MSEPSLRPVPPPPDDPVAARGDYEYRLLTLPRGTSRSEARRLITELAEHGHWELARTRLSFGGKHHV